MKTDAPDYLIRLRAATKQLHGEAETYTDSERLLGNSPDLTHYRRFLAAHYLLHQQIARHSAELNAQGISARILDWPNCPRIESLSDDLKQLNARIDSQAFTQLPQQSHGFTLGLVYVSEGSCIGNQRVLKALNRHASFRSWNSRSFLSNCKTGFADRRSALLSSMNLLSTQGSQIDGSGYEELERGAIAGFDLYMAYWSALDTQSFPEYTKKSNDYTEAAQA